MTKPELDVGPLSPSDWRELRTTRLRALLESPEAFDSTYSTSTRHDDSWWQQQFHGATWLVARDQGKVVGLAGLIDSPDGPHVQWVWVVPRYRRQGAFRSLLDRLVEIGRDANLESVFLWVVGDNEVARRAYTSVGFVPTKEEQPLNGDRIERRLELRLSGP